MVGRWLEGKRRSTALKEVPGALCAEKRCAHGHAHVSLRRSCPVCDKLVRQTHLIFDPYFAEILENTDPSTEEVEVWGAVWGRACVRGRRSSCGVWVGLHACVRSSSVCSSQGKLGVRHVHWPLTQRNVPVLMTTEHCLMPYHNCPPCKGMDGPRPRPRPRAKGTAQALSREGGQCFPASGQALTPPPLLHSSTVRQNGLRWPCFGD